MKKVLLKIRVIYLNLYKGLLKISIELHRPKLSQLLQSKGLESQDFRKYNYKMDDLITRYTLLDLKHVELSREI